MTATVALPCACSPSPLGRKIKESGRETVEVAGLNGVRESVLSLATVVYAAPQGISVRDPLASDVRN